MLNMRREYYREFCVIVTKHETTVRDTNDIARICSSLAAFELFVQLSVEREQCNALVGCQTYKVRVVPRVALHCMII